MSDDDWDADDDFQPPTIAPKAEDRWAEEDAEEEEQPAAPRQQASASAAYEEMTKEQLVAELVKRDREGRAPKGRKAQRKMLRQRDQAEREEREAQMAARAQETVLTAEEQYARKMQLQQRVEEADLELAQELFAGDAEAGEAPTMLLIEAMNPETQEEFDAMRTSIARKVTKYETAALYAGFVSDLVGDVVLGMEDTDIRKLEKRLGVIASEKQKAKAPKSKKKKKAQLGGGIKGGGADAFDDFSAYAYDYDGFT